MCDAMVFPALVRLIRLIYNSLLIKLMPLCNGYSRLAKDCPLAETHYRQTDHETAAK